MSDDLIARLRASDGPDWHLLAEAADEIERLLTEIEQLRGAVYVTGSGEDGPRLTHVSLVDVSDL